MRIKSIFSLIGLLVGFTVFSQKLTNEQIEKKVEDLVKDMKVEEKVGQMTQLTLKYFLEDNKLNDSIINEHIVKYSIGSVLGAGDYARDVKEWHDIIKKLQDAAKGTRTKIPILYGIDAVHGANFTQNATLFPHNIGLAASRNTDLVKQTAKICSKEVRASGIRWNFDPVLGLGRNPLWPRFEETFGEDVYLTSEMGVAVVKAYEEDGLENSTAVASCMKHYLGYSVPLSGKDRTPAYIPDIVLREYFLPPFKSAIDAGSSTLMVNSASVNGVPVHGNKYLLTDLLKKELGFKGVIVTDWKDIINLYKEHKVAKNNKSAVKLAVNAGVDISMVPENLSFYHDLIELVKEGNVKIERIDDAVKRILTLKYKLGLFDNPYVEKEAIKHFDRIGYNDIALQASRESIVLLKNDKGNGKESILPLNKTSKVLIAGPASNSHAALHGSWSFVWQGNDESKYPKENKTIKDAIIKKIGKKNAICNSEKGFYKVTDKHISELKENAKNVDCIILCLGENAYAETPGNIDDLILPEDQLKLAKAAIATKKPIVLLLAEGRPLIIREIESGINSILMLHRPGCKGGDAVSDILFGDYNPDGRLAFSYPKYSGNIMTYDGSYRDMKYYKPQWEFGHGLSYSDFEFSAITLLEDTLRPKRKLDIQLYVKNKGPFDANISVELYTRDLVASITPPQKRLRKFKKIFLKSGRAESVKFELTKDDISFINKYLVRVTEEGEFEIMIGDKKKKFYYKKR